MYIDTSKTNASSHRGFKVFFLTEVLDFLPASCDSMQAYVRVYVHAHACLCSANYEGVYHSDINVYHSDMNIIIRGPLRPGVSTGLTCMRVHKCVIHAAGESTIPKKHAHV